MATLTVKLGDEDLGEVDFERFTLSDAYLVKGETGLTPKALFEGIGELDPLALQGLVWYLRRKKGDVTGHARAIDFAIGDLKIEEQDEDPTEETSGSGDAVTSVSSPTTAT